MWAFLLSAFIVINPNPYARDDWHQLRDDYQFCADVSESRFQFIVCTTGAYERAINPTYSA